MGRHIRNTKKWHNIRTNVSLSLFLLYMWMPSGYHTWSLKETRKAPEELPVDRACIWPREGLRFNLQHQPQNIKSQGMEKNQTENKGKIQRGRQFT